MSIEQTMPPSNLSTTKPSWRSVAITQAIAILGCVVVPAAVTFVAPRTTIELRSVEGRAEAVVTKHILLFVPASVITIAPVTAVESRVRAAEYKRKLDAEDIRKGRAHYRAGDGSILLTGANGTAHIQSTPEDAPREVEQIRNFLMAPTAEPLAITATAGLLFSYVLGGIMTGLAALYCIGAVLAVAQWLLGLARPSPAPSPDRLL